MTAGEENILSVFGSRLKSRNGSTSEKTQFYAYRAFASFVAGRSLSINDFDEKIMAEWASWMFYEGFSKSTVLSYLRLVYALCNDKKYDKSSELKSSYSSVSKQIQALPDTIFKQNTGSRVVHKLQKMLETNRMAVGETRLATDIVIFSVLCGGLNFEQLSQWKKDDKLPDFPLLHEIRERYARPRHKYLFPLGQAILTPKQLATRLRELFIKALRPYGIPTASDATATACDIWLTALYESTGSIRQAVNITQKGSSTAPAFALIRPDAGLSDEQRSYFCTHLRNILAKDPVQWHAMQFRPGVTYARVMERMNMHDNAKRFTEVYYPVVEIATRVGHKIVFDEKPVMAGLMFFMSRESDITPLFRSLGDLAWCYRTSREPGASYAVIPDSEIALLQRAIGYIDPKTEIKQESEVTFEAGDKIVLSSGRMAGYYAEITLVEKKNGKQLYHLSFPDGNGYTWRVSADSLQAEKVG